MVIIIILLAIIIKILNGLLHKFSFLQNFLFTTKRQWRKNKNELKEESSRKRTVDIKFIHIWVCSTFIFLETLVSFLQPDSDPWPLTPRTAEGWLHETGRDCTYLDMFDSTRLDVTEWGRLETQRDFRLSLSQHGFDLMQLEYCDSMWLGKILDLMWLEVCVLDLMCVIKCLDVNRLLTNSK